MKRNPLNALSGLALAAVLLLPVPALAAPKAPTATASVTATVPAGASADARVQEALQESLKDVRVSMDGPNTVIRTGDGKTITIEGGNSVSFLEYAVVGLLCLSILTSLLRLAKAARDLLGR